MTRYSVTRRLEFDAAHRVPLHESKCKHLHGHRYVVEITASAEALDEKGFVVDFGVLKRGLGQWIDTNLDHNTIYQAGDAPMERARVFFERERRWFAMDCAPTAENLARMLFEVATNTFVYLQAIKIERVRVYETPNCWAEWPCASIE